MDKELDSTSRGIPGAIHESVAYKVFGFGDVKQYRKWAVKHQSRFTKMVRKECWLSEAGFEAWLCSTNGNEDDT